MLQTANWIDELSYKYRLSEDAVKEEIEKAISAALTKRLGFEVEVVCNEKPNLFELIGYKEKYGDIRVIQIMPETIKKRLLREIKYTIVNALLIRSIMEDYELNKHKIKTVIYGTIIKQKTDDGSVYVHIQDIEGRNDVVAVMDRASQTPKERGWYMEGQTLPFYVLNVNPVILKGTPRLEIRLSRNSTGLPECLIRQELIAQNIDTKVRCIRRIAGAFSEIKASAKIPRDCIKKVSDELKERIIVRW